MFKLLLILLWPFRQAARFFILAYERWPATSLIARTPERQSQVDREIQSLVLYQMEACPYCVKVRKHLRKLGLSLSLRDIKRDPSALSELKQGGGQDQVPCLKITPAQGGVVQWMYESSDINAYLSQRFGEKPASSSVA